MYEFQNDSVIISKETKFQMWYHAQKILSNNAKTNIETFYESSWV